MPRITVKLGSRERLRPSLLKGTPMGALATEGIVELGPLLLTGPPAALRELAAALGEAAAMAELYDADPAAYDRAEAIARADQ